MPPAVSDVFSVTLESVRVKSPPVWLIAPPQQEALLRVRVEPLMSTLVFPEKIAPP